MVLTFRYISKSEHYDRVIPTIDMVRNIHVVFCICNRRKKAETDKIGSKHF